MDRPSDATDFTSSHYFPNRRRVWQACTNCRNRKTRCDAAKPRCSLCATQDVECVYKDSQQPRIEHNTRILLERIQALEDRIFSSGALQAAPPPAPTSSTAGHVQPHDEPFRGEPSGGKEAVPDGDTQIPIPLSHTANANHVLDWPIVKQLLKDSRILPAPSTASADMPSTTATDIFFQPTGEESAGRPPPESWRLFRDNSLQGPTESPDQLRDCVHSYFEGVNVFFPLLSLSDVNSILEQVIVSETRSATGSPHHQVISTAEYALLLVVLCLGSFVRRGESMIRLSTMSSQAFNDSDTQWSLHDRLWQKAKLLLGYLSSEATLKAAQCSMLARSVAPGTTIRCSRSNPT